MKDIKVYGMAVLGSIASGLDWFVNNLGPILDILVRLGQVAVAVVTVLYIYRKWKTLKKDDNDDV